MRWPHWVAIATHPKTYVLLWAGRRSILWRIFCSLSFFVELGKWEMRPYIYGIPCFLCKTRIASTCLPLPPMWDMRSQCVSPFFFIRTEQLSDSVYCPSTTEHKTSSETTIFSHKCQMKVKFSHIEHISHKYPMKVKFSHKWPYFHTLSTFYTIILLLSIMFF
jgi:hypothetical protein